MHASKHTTIAAKMEQPTKGNSSKLFVRGEIESKDEIEERFERAYANVQQQINGLNEKDLHDVIMQMMCKDKMHEDMSIGFLYIMLTDTVNAHKTYRELSMVVRDGLNMVVSNLTMLIAEKYTKLTEVGRIQVMWLLRELVKHKVLNVENTVWNCLRQAAGGDVSAKNIYLVESLLDILIDHRCWLETQPFLIQTVVFTYVRLLEDHIGSAALAQLRQKEVKFVVALMRERFQDILPLGRDFVRLLQNVARVPEIELLWRDILYNSKCLHPTFSGIWQMLQIRTSRRFLQCRLTPDQERKLTFLITHVKFGIQKRYQDWFSERYFNTPESQSLRSDFIRFIVNVIHPTNDMLCSDIIPRWAIIGWLLSSCLTNFAALANAKLALFYDWLFFDPIKDNIMNIEPAILVMFQSIRSHPSVTNTLLDFLCRITKHFALGNEEKVRQGVYNSLHKILEKQVIPNLQPLFESPRLDRDLRNLIHENFKEFLSPAALAGNMAASPITAYPAVASIIQSPVFKKEADQRLLTPNALYFAGSPVNTQQQHELVVMQNHFQHNTASSNVLDMNEATAAGMLGSTFGGIHMLAVNALVDEDNKLSVIPADNMDIETEVQFSDDDASKDNKNDDLTDDDDDLPLSKVRLKEKPTPDKTELPASISDSFETFVNKRNSFTFESFLEDFRTLPASALDEAQLSYVISNTHLILRETLPQQNLFVSAAKTDEKNLAKSISYPLFGLFRFLYENEDKSKKPFQSMLAEVCKRIPEIGYLLLYFMKVHVKLQTRKNAQKAYQFKTNIYKQICDAADKKIDDCLAHDLALLEQENTAVFLSLLPDIYREFSSNAVNNSDLLRIILRCIDAKNLRDLIYYCAQGKLVIFKEDGVLDCIRDSLSYETYEQLCLWQLVQAHDVSIRSLQDIIPELEAANHSEALTYMLLLLKNEEPTNELLRLLLSRETKSRGEPFVTSALRFWCQRHEMKLSEIIASLLNSKYPGSSPNKRKRPPKGSSSNNSIPSAEQMLNHLEHYRRSCRHGAGTALFVYEPMQRALQLAYTHSNESTKKQYSDMFALAGEDETTVTRRGGTARGRKQPTNKKDANSHGSSSKKNSDPVKTIYSSDEESSEEDWTKHKSQAKKRKKAINDSD